MKKYSSLVDAKSKISSLIGQEVTLKLNRGRNRVKSYKGVVKEAHQNVFVVALSESIFDRISCSYTDMLCGDIAVTPIA